MTVIQQTQAELSRCLLELTRVKTSNFTEEELQQQDEEYLASLPKPKPKPAQPPETKPVEKKVAPPKLTKEEEAFRDKWLRLIDMIRKGRLDRASEFWGREGTASRERPVVCLKKAQHASARILELGSRRKAVESRPKSVCFLRRIRHTDSGGDGARFPFGLRTPEFHRLASVRQDLW